MTTCNDCGEQNPADIHNCGLKQADSLAITHVFTGLPMRKLRLLLKVFETNGVAITRTEEDGTVRRGAVTTGGMVLWWPGGDQQALETHQAIAKMQALMVQAADALQENVDSLIESHTDPVTKLVHWEVLPGIESDADLIAQLRAGALPWDQRQTKQALAQPAQPADESVAWVEVKCTHEGPYEFHGKELLPVGKHDLYTRPQPAEFNSTTSMSSTSQPSDEESQRMDAAEAVLSLAFSGVLPDRFEDVAEWIVAGKMPGPAPALPEGWSFEPVGSAIKLIGPDGKSWVYDPNGSDRLTWELLNTMLHN